RVARHPRVLRALDRVREGRVVVGVGAALASGDLDRTQELREDLAALRVDLALLFLDAFPVRMAAHDAPRPMSSESSTLSWARGTGCYNSRDGAGTGNGSALVALLAAADILLAAPQLLFPRPKPAFLGRLHEFRRGFGADGLRRGRPEGARRPR